MGTIRSMMLTLCALQMLVLLLLLLCNYCVQSNFSTKYTICTSITADKTILNIHIISKFSTDISYILINPGIVQNVTHTWHTCHAPIH